MKLGRKSKDLPSKQGDVWKPTYELCRKHPNGSRQVVASYFTLDEAQARAKIFQASSLEQYHIFDLLTRQFIVSAKLETKSHSTLPDFDIKLRDKNRN